MMRGLLLLALLLPSGCALLQARFCPDPMCPRLVVQEEPALWRIEVDEVLPDGRFVLTPETWHRAGNNEALLLEALQACTDQSRRVNEAYSPDRGPL